MISKLNRAVLFAAIVSLFQVEVGASDNIILNLLTRRYIASHTDHYLSQQATETVGIQEGQIFYVPYSNLSDTAPLYELYHNDHADHMTSRSTDESDYHLKKALGYAFTTGQSYLSPIRRWYRATYGDRMIAFNEEDPGWFGYSLEAVLGYGFPRFGKRCETNFVLSSGDVTIKANKQAGGAISELSWNGKQFINNYDYGRQIQIAFNFTNTAEYDNPTEAGSVYGCPGIVDAPYAQGSPIVYVTASGPTLLTKTHPLQWQPENWGGGPDRPVMWKGTIEKSVTLNYDTKYSAHVIKWVSTLNVPAEDVTGSGDWELVAAYLTSDFNKQYSFDAQHDVLTDKSDVVPNNDCRGAPEDEDYRPDSGGVINATADSNYALGVYRTRTDGHNHFVHCKFLNSHGGGKYGADATKWSVMGRESMPGVRAGVNTGVVYLIVGTLDDVVDTMRGMYLDGY